MTQMAARLYQRPRTRFRHWEPGFFSMQLSFRKSLYLAVALALLVGSPGCVYRPNIAQGNIVEEEDLDQVKVGMTRNQVRFLLGTPMIDDPFHANRWDYVYYVKIGRKDASGKRWVTILFDDDTVSEIQRNRELAEGL
jgi:outer membrane protein assembly factor BamE